MKASYGSRPAIAKRSARIPDLPAGKAGLYPSPSEPMMPEPADISEKRRKKLLFRSWHRGTREMDLLLGRFADRHIGTLSDDELDLFSAVLRCADQDLYDWVTGKSPWPAPLQNALTLRLTRYTRDQSDR